MHDRSCQFDVAHPLTPHLGLNNFDAALFADYATMAHPFVLTAVTFVIFGRAKYFRAKQTIAFRFESPVIDRLRLFYFAMGPRANLVGRRNRNLDRVKTKWILRFLE